MYPTGQQLPLVDQNQLKREPSLDSPTTPTASFQELLLTESNISSASQPPTETVMHQCPHPDCGRQFSRKYTLTEHMKTHTGEKPHVCPVRTCNKRFSTSGNLARHKRLHGFIQPIECPVEGCVCTFPSDNKLEKHMKFHYGGPVHVCEVLGCGKTFSTTGNLNRHMKNQHPDVYNPHAHAGSTPTDKKSGKKKPLKKSPTSAEDWSQSSSNGDNHHNEDAEEEDDDDEERQERKPKWPASYTIKTEPGAIDSDDDEDSDDEDDDEDEMTTDGILDSLSSLLEDTDITRKNSVSSGMSVTSMSASPAARPSSSSQNLFDDIIRFHVEDLGGYHASK